MRVTIKGCKMSFPADAINKDKADQNDEKRARGIADKEIPGQQLFRGSMSHGAKQECRECKLNDKLSKRLGGRLIHASQSCREVADPNDKENGACD